MRAGGVIGSHQPPVRTCMSGVKGMDMGTDWDRSGYNKA
jgi:hypothetical protein